MNIYKKLRVSILKDDKDMFLSVIQNRKKEDAIGWKDVLTDVLRYGSIDILSVIVSDQRISMKYGILPSSLSDAKGIISIIDRMDEEQMNLLDILMCALGRKGYLNDQLIVSLIEHHISVQDCSDVSSGVLLSILSPWITDMDIVKKIIPEYIWVTL